MGELLGFQINEDQKSDNPYEWPFSLRVSKNEVIPCLKIFVFIFGVRLTHESNHALPGLDFGPRRLIWAPSIWDRFDCKVWPNWLKPFDLHRPIVFLWKDLDSIVNKVSAQDTCSISKMCFALSKRPHLHEGYIVSSPIFFVMSVGFLQTMFQKK